MISYDEAVRYLAQKRFDKWKAGANDDRVDVTDVAYIYEKSQAEVTEYVNQIFEMWKVR